jgi:hypothetical protein
MTSAIRNASNGANGVTATGSTEPIPITAIRNCPCPRTFWTYSPAANASPISASSATGSPNCGSTSTCHGVPVAAVAPHPRAAGAGGPRLRERSPDR